MVDTNITTISIPKPLAEKIKVRIEGTGFNSVSSYVTYVLRQVLSKVESEEQPNKPKEAFTEEDERKVKERLRSLGYLD
jgi:Arc/MetJ-type ribon-helix-helix transcriptional regulator